MPNKFHVSDGNLESVQRLLRCSPEPRHQGGYQIGRHATLDECAAALGVSREGARKIEVRALKKVRAWLERQGISRGDL